MIDRHDTFEAHRAMSERATILIVSSCWWAFPARLAMAFAELGYRVDAICPAHHPLLKTGSVHAVHRYGILRPLRALTGAIASSNPVLIVPCDDRAVMHLHWLHTALRSSAGPIPHLIERSLGSKDSFGIADRRSDLIRIARDEGIRCPQMLPVAKPEQLRSALEQVGLPAVMKVDGSWGGLGVSVVHSSAEAERVLAASSRRTDALQALKRWIVDRDPFSLLPFVTRARPVVNVQAFVAGRPANSAVACWNGEVLAAITAEVVQARDERGASTVVRIVDNREMAEASARLVRRLGLSGFCGFDFVLDDRAGAAHLVEMNARSTPISHLALGGDRNLVASMAARLGGQPVPAPARAIHDDLVAFFPQAWLLEPGSELLHLGHHDVPWAEAGLIRELIQAPWPERGRLARFLARLRLRAGRRSASADAAFHAASLAARPAGGRDGMAAHSVVGTGACTLERAGCRKHYANRGG
ncbi:MAG TPA: ATP-grasp domain-containing protein, partial [Stellaceae bacterium]|nr:ATP-grasp domain-containing protein [Stellaceae bacterium]